VFIIIAQFGGLFSNPWMLGWLAAAAAPLVIHLLTRRQFREEPWAAMEFLMAAMRKAARRMRIEQLLLLIVRTLIIVLIVISAANLQWSSSPGHSAAGHAVLKVLVIDRSYSMAYKADDQSRFDLAKAAAIQQMGQGHPGDAFLVVLMGDPPEVVVEEPAFYPAEVLVAELQDPTAIPLEHRGADLTSTLAKVQELIEHNLKRFPQFAAAQVYCFTDLARHTWAPGAVDSKSTSGRDKSAGKGSQSAAVKQRIEKLRELIGDRIYVVDVSSSGSENVAVTDVRVVAPYATVGRPLRIEAKVKNFGTQPRRALEAEVLIDSQRVKSFELDVLAGQEVSLPSIEHTFDTPGEHLIEVRTDDDSLAVDNHRWEAIRVEPALRVLCINGKPDSDPLRDGAAHLTMALSALDQPDRLPRIQTRTILETELLSTGVDLAEYHAVIISNVAQINREEARRLITYMKRGGAVIMFLGDQVRAETYHRNLRTEKEKKDSILPATIGPVVRGPLRGFELGKYDNPITNYFRSQRGPGLSRPLIGNYYRLNVDKDVGTKVLLDFVGGDPAIVAHDVGRGTCVMVATTAAVDPAGESVWSAMPYEKLYVPMIHKILESAVAGQLSKNTVQVGQPLSLSMRTSAPEINYRLDFDQPEHGPPQKLYEGAYNLDKNAGRWIYDDTTLAGVYRLRIKTPVEQQAQFAVNVDTAESNLARADDEELPEGVVVLKSGEEIASDSALDTAAHDDPAHAALLYAVLGLLLAESLLAWRISHRSL
jgi:hypothetical protein